ncbi:mammalian cell entry protein [Mycobacterium sp. 1245499.0]|uniref:mammalian cell entry protein n=1 Tax=unclassified Mycobacterium TaxID=2642494 RepID=UPI0007FBED24|nr:MULTISPECIES: mammalian cell entry protein [unclassified Mycobacterium]OBJ10965.1 mammalian cell entry protein [Mycobacterium sp. 1482292.6]OBJ22941.1 mammalian cell entry protein [Mycobacterium sp. 1245801.1]OBL07418.1 mammalian cell entry protein [Mycobacterium sp. 1245499.0]
MSPRRRFAPGERPLLIARPVEAGRPWLLPLAGTVAAALMVVAITACTLMLVSHEIRARAASKDREVLTYVTGFMTQFISIDPFHANDYVNRILAQATGDFAKQYEKNANEILLQVARAEPATGTVLDAGLERWNDDGSANVMVATAISTKSPDEKQVLENANRWAATATQEGNKWKISNLQQVM